MFVYFWARIFIYPLILLSRFASVLLVLIVKQMLLLHNNFIGHGLRAAGLRRLQQAFLDGQLDVVAPLPSAALPREHHQAGTSRPTQPRSKDEAITTFDGTSFQRALPRLDRRPKWDTHNRIVLDDGIVPP